MDEKSLPPNQYGKRTVKYFIWLFILFGAVLAAAGAVGYNIVAGQLKEQLATKCSVLATAVAAIVAEDSAGYAAFLEDMDMGSEYYARIKALLTSLREANVEHVTYIYTVLQIDDAWSVYVLGGEPPDSPAYTPPGTPDATPPLRRAAFEEQGAALGGSFVSTPYGVRLTAYAPIFHRETGEFLGLAGADVVQEQFSGIMGVFAAQTAIGLLAGIVIFAVSMRWLSGRVSAAISQEEHAAELARDMARRKAEFLQDISHEMKKPLNVISTAIDLADMKMRAGHGAESAERALAAAQRETGRLGRMVDGMVNMASIGESRESRRRASISELILNSADSFAISLKQNNVALKLDVAENLPDVFVERDRMAQVLSNLLANLAAHAKNSEATLAAAACGEYIAVSMADTGPGIEQGLLPNVFGRGASGAQGGTGYGLYICKTIAEAHGGSIEIESRPGRGTRVTFTVPVYGGQEAGHKPCQGK